MRPDGDELVARWREAGRWWENESPREILQVRDPRGVLRTDEQELQRNEHVTTDKRTLYRDDRREDYSLRPRKLRDAKVKRAMGYVEPEVHVSLQSASAPYAALHVLSGYSFGRSVLFAVEIPRLAANRGIPAVALADRFSLAGAMEFARECHKCGVKPLIGATLEMAEGGELVLLARSAHGYRNLSHLVTECHLGEPRLFPLCTRERLQRHASGLICLTGGDAGPIDRLLVQRRYKEAEEWMRWLQGLFGSVLFAEVERAYLPWTQDANRRLLELADRCGVTPVAGGVVTHGSPEQFPAQDALCCAQTLATVEEPIGRKPQRDESQPQVKPRPVRALNAERYLRDTTEMRALYCDRPDLLNNTMRIADLCEQDVLPSRTRLPQTDIDTASHLRTIVMDRAYMHHRKPGRELRRRIEEELERIIRLGFADHFYTCWDICRWAGDQGILFSGRGSVVDSVVAYYLGFSRINAFDHNLHFDRFLPADGSKRPDIDIDFEARRRDDVRNYMVNKYGKERVATVAAFGAYCSRGILRDCGKALGLEQETIGFLAKRVHRGIYPAELEDAMDKRPELRDSNIDRGKLRWLFRLAEMCADIPINIRAHSSGVVLSNEPIADTVPVMHSAGLQPDENLRIMQWDKRSAKHCFDKIDVLCLRGQDVLGGLQERIRLSDSDFNVESLPLDDEDTYRTMRSGQLIGIPQSASPAMRQAHIRMRTKNLADASLVQAGIRPGVGGSVKINELIARRRGKAFAYEHPDLEKVLGNTYGIIVFQEQVDLLLQTFCGYSSGEAEEIRDEIHKRRREDYGQVIKDELIARVQENGYDQATAERVFDLVAGFKGYGFAQGHALAFAEISIRSIYGQQNFPTEYFASLLDAQPAGYYGPCTLVNEARSRGVKILPPDVNRSAKRFEVEDVKSDEDPKIVLPGAGIRVALAQVGCLSRDFVELVERKRPYRSLFDFVTRVHPARDELEQLILCGAFDGLHPNRRSLLWAIPAAYEHALGQTREGELTFEQPVPPLHEMPDFSEAEKAIRERRVLRLDVERHLMAYEREHVETHGGITTREANKLPHNEKAVVVGCPIRLRFPPTPSGKRVCFFDLEDECGLLNVTCFDAVYKRDGHAIVCSPYVALRGHAQVRDGHTGFMATRVFPYKPQITKLVEKEDRLPIKTHDFLVG